ncbi:MAG: radical SAM protein [Planctomycetota bacterium]
MPHSKSVAVVFLQPHCNMTCDFCVTEDDFDRMTPAQVTTLLEHLRRRRFTAVVFGGGEPFAWPGDLVAITEHARRLGFMVQVGTNGTVLPDGFARISSIDRYVLPLEAVRPEIHDRMRRWPGGHHAVIMRRLGDLKEARRSVTLSTVVTAINLDEIVAIGRFLAHYHRDAQHVHAWHLYRFLPLGRGGSVNAEALEIPETEYRRIVREVRHLRLPFKVFKRADMYDSKTVEFFWCSEGRVVTGEQAWRGCVVG